MRRLRSGPATAGSRAAEQLAIPSAELREAVAFDTRILLDLQAESGAFPASPGFSQYPYSWLRDGAFIAHALDLAGEHEAARRFHEWVAGTLLGHAGRIEALLEAHAAGRRPAAEDFLPARFTLDGEWLEDGWPNFQMDGYGQWLWSLERHIALSDLPWPWPLRAAVGPEPELLSAARLATRYVTAFWREPCYDAWEEHRSQLHTSTLASCWAGLRAATVLLGNPGPTVEAEQVLRLVETECVRDSSLIKYVRNEAVDASLLWAVVPFGMFPPGSPVARATLDRVRGELLDSGGVIRYRADTYYGGGAWLLLTAWLGWVELESGDRASAFERWEWVQAHRGADGSLPEQVPAAGTDPWFLDWWTRGWGSSASPLLWSHALSLILGLGLLDEANRDANASSR